MGAGVYLSGVKDSRCNGFYSFVDFSTSTGRGIFVAARLEGSDASSGQSSSDASALCGSIWKDGARGAWVLSRGPVDGDTWAPPLPALRSTCQPNCLEDVLSFTALATSSVGKSSISVATQTTSPSSTAANVWYAAPRFRRSPPSPLSEGTASNASADLCYLFEYGENYSTSIGARPVTGIPATHPTVTRPAGIRSCTTSLTAGEPIPATGTWHQTGCGASRTVNGGDLFYAYNFPQSATGNTGYLYSHTLGVYFVQDAAGDVYFVTTIGKPNTVRGSMQLYATSTGLAGGSTRIVRSDDRREAEWNSQSGTGAFQWRWGRCCGDGAVLGPMPSTGFSMTFTSDAWSNVGTVRLASYSSTTSTLSFESVSTGVAFGSGRGLRVRGFTCEDFCATLQSCGECTASEFCGWCGATSTCMSSSTRCPAAYTPPLTCCAECTQQSTIDGCLSRPGCGFLFDRAAHNAQVGHCVSGTPHSSPCDTVGSDLSIATTFV